MVSSHLANAITASSCQRNFGADDGPLGTLQYLVLVGLVVFFMTMLDKPSVNRYLFNDVYYLYIDVTNNMLSASVFVKIILRRRTSEEPFVPSQLQHDHVDRGTQSIKPASLRAAP